MATAEATATGKISQIVGVVVDIEFDKGALPAINNALETELMGEKLLFEVAQHLSETSVRAIALGATDGLKRGAAVIDTGNAISVPIGEETLGRMFNVTGEPIDGKGGTFTQKRRFTARRQNLPTSLVTLKSLKLALKSST